MRESPASGKYHLKSVVSHQLLDSREMLRSLMLAGSWLLLWRLAVLMEYAPHASIWFPSAGLSFAAFLILGLRAVPIVMLCSLIATFWVDDLYAMHQTWTQLAYTGVLFGAAHCFSYYCGAKLLKQLVRRSFSDALPKIILSFLILGSLSALLAALLGTQVLAGSGLIEQQEAASIWLPWWIGDMAGTIVLTPLFIGLLSWRYPLIEGWLGGLDFQQSGQGLYGFLVKLLISSSLLTLTMLLAAQFRYSEVSFAVFFLIIPQMWIVYTESAFRASLSLAVFSTLTAVWVASLSLMDYALVYQFAICVISASAYFGLAVPVLAAHNAQLRELALSDGLTKVASRQYFFERAEQELLRARRYQQPISLLVFDIDHFKQINDQFGHTAGDSALVLVAEAIGKGLRQSDLLGRFGGDEFLLLLPGIDLDKASETAERLRQALRGVKVADTRHFLSGSFGVVQIERHEDFQDAFERADECLLKAKKAGRDQVFSSRPAEQR
ncbi:sensor domain-containing diguanylate cyclase [Bowmanella denitrificans]|uniref:sensor domain-containing diguanylate cyclase n=1 Tax=Bowmanella denitrificans TaxID=366582 RepID=UPI0011AF8EFF|nr:diguanylate cyclase [Bowmanella denitrificans]